MPIGLGKHVHFIAAAEVCEHKCMGVDVGIGDIFEYKGTELVIELSYSSAKLAVFSFLIREFLVDHP